MTNPINIFAEFRTYSSACITVRLGTSKTRAAKDIREAKRLSGISRRSADDIRSCPMHVQTWDGDFISIDALARSIADGTADLGAWSVNLYTPGFHSAEPPLDAELLDSVYVLVIPADGPDPSTDEEPQDTDTDTDQGACADCPRAQGVKPIRVSAVQAQALDYLAGSPRADGWRSNATFRKVTWTALIGKGLATRQDDPADALGFLVRLTFAGVMVAASQGAHSQWDVCGQVCGQRSKADALNATDAILGQLRKTPTDSSAIAAALAGTAASPKVGDLVRSFDFANGDQGRDLTGPRACYMVGRIIAIGTFHQFHNDCARYQIAVISRTWNGVVENIQTPQADVFVPANGTPTSLGRTMDSVEVIERPQLAPSQLAQEATRDAPEAPDLDTRVIDALAGAQDGLKAPALRQLLDVRASDLLPALKRLESLGCVSRTGKTRGTIWHLG